LEVEYLLDWLKYERAGMNRFPAFLGPLEEGGRGIYNAICEGRYSFGRGDLPFMDVAEANADDIPFHSLLK
jgi:hypothetical protein